MSDQEKLRRAIDGFKDIAAVLTSLAVLTPQTDEEALIHYEDTCLAIMQVSNTLLNQLLDGVRPETYLTKGVH